jgi:transcription elongation factor GreB
MIMSRAFVDESSSDSRDEDAPEFKNPLPAGERNYITQEGAVKLTAELHLLEAGERPKLTAEILHLGNDPTNADSLATVRRKLSRLDRRIEYLSRMASLAEVVERPASGFEQVRFGARVTVQDRRGALSSFRIVGVDEADPNNELVSWTAPLVRALMGKRPGNTVAIQLPDGETTLTVVSVE